MAGNGWQWLDNPSVCSPALRTGGCQNRSPRLPARQARLACHGANRMVYRRTLCLTPRAYPIDKRALVRQAALEYHEFPKPGKIAVAPTKQLVNQHDLALAYSPGVAAPCEEIVKDPAAAFKYTSRGNLVGVVTNGTAVLGLGDIGPLAGKPVMEGKAVLFKSSRH